MCTKQINADNPVMFILTIVGGNGTPSTTTPPGKSSHTPTGPHVSNTGNVTMQPDGMSHVCTYNISAIENKSKRRKVEIDCKMLGLIPQPYLPTFTAIPLSIAHTFTHMHASCTTETPMAIISLSSLMSPFPIGTFIAVGVGVGVFLLFVMVIMVVIILVAVFVKRKAVYKQKRDTTMGDNLHCSNTVVAEQEMELKEKGVGADKDAERGPIADGFDPYEIVDREVHIKNAKKLASVTSVPAVYATVDKSKKKGTKKGTKKETGDRSTARKNAQYAMPMKKKVGKTTDIGEGVIGSGGVEEGEQYDDIVRPTYEPKADSESGQRNEGGSN